MKKLYKVRVQAEFEMCVMAEDKIAALNIARRNVDNDVANQSSDELFDIYDPRPIETSDEVPAEWADCVPWGGDGKKSVKELVK